MEFIPMEKKYIKECAALFVSVFLNPPWFDKWESGAQAEKYLEELIENPVFWGAVAIEEGCVCAACLGHTKTWFDGTQYVIDEFFVDKKRSGQGTGSCMLFYVKNEMRQKKIHCILLQTGKGFPAEKFYKKNGFFLDDSMITMIYRE